MGNSSSFLSVSMRNRAAMAWRQPRRLLGLPFDPKPGRTKKLQVGGRRPPGLARLPRQAGSKPTSRATKDLETRESWRRTGRQTGTRATRSHLPRSRSEYQKAPAIPPSARLAHINQKRIMNSSWFSVGGVPFRRLVIDTATLPLPCFFIPRSGGPRNGKLQNQTARHCPRLTPPSRRGRQDLRTETVRFDHFTNFALSGTRPDEVNKKRRFVQK